MTDIWKPAGAPSSSDGSEGPPVPLSHLAGATLSVGLGTALLGLPALGLALSTLPDCNVWLVGALASLSLLPAAAAGLFRARWPAALAGGAGALAGSFFTGSAALEIAAQRSVWMNAGVEQGEQLGPILAESVSTTLVVSLGWQWFALLAGACLAAAAASLGEHRHRPVSMLTTPALTGLTLLLSSIVISAAGRQLGESVAAHLESSVLGTVLVLHVVGTSTLGMVALGYGTRMGKGSVGTALGWLHLPLALLPWLPIAMLSSSVGLQALFGLLGFVAGALLAPVVATAPARGTLGEVVGEGLLQGVVAISLLGIAGAGCGLALSTGSVAAIPSLTTGESFDVAEAAWQGFEVRGMAISALAGGIVNTLCFTAPIALVTRRMEGA